MTSPCCSRGTPPSCRTRARAGAAVLATDACAEALALLALNAQANDVPLETARVDWTAPEEL